MFVIACCYAALYTGHFVEGELFFKDLTATVEFIVGSSQQNSHSSSRTVLVFLSKDIKMFFNGKVESIFF